MDTTSVSDHEAQRPRRKRRRRIVLAALILLLVGYVVLSMTLLDEEWLRVRIEHSVRDT